MEILDTIHRDWPLLWSIASIITIGGVVVWVIGLIYKLPKLLRGPLGSWFKANGETLVLLGIFATSIGSIGWLLLSGVRWIQNRPEPQQMEWVHPSLSREEQDRTIAQCNMRAYEATTGDHYQFAPRNRSNYLRSCLIAEGFAYMDIPSRD